MILTSLLINIFVLIPISLLLFRNGQRAVTIYGESTVARRILLSIYLAILIASVLFLFFQDPKMIMSLLLLQVIYKLLTPFIVGQFTHPVVMSNIAIAIVHCVTLVTIFLGN